MGNQMVCPCLRNSESQSAEEYISCDTCYSWVNHWNLSITSRCLCGMIIERQCCRCFYRLYLVHVIPNLETSLPLAVITNVIFPYLYSSDYIASSPIRLRFVQPCSGYKCQQTVCSRHHRFSSRRARKSRRYYCTSCIPERSHIPPRKANYLTALMLRSWRASPEQKEGWVDAIRRLST